MAAAIGYSTHGRKVFNNLPFAKRLAAVSALPLSDRSVEFSALIHDVQSAAAPNTMDDFVITLIENHPNLLSEEILLQQPGLLSIARRFIEENRDRLLQQNAVDYEALISIGSMSLHDDQFQYGLAFIRDALRAAPSQTIEDNIKTFLSVLTPHQYSQHHGLRCMPAGSEKTVVISDKGIRPEFISGLLSQIGPFSGTFHFFGDIENKHQDGLHLPHAVLRSGCRDVIGRYAAEYPNLASACHSAAQHLAAVITKDSPIGQAVTGDGFAASMTLMMSDQLFWTAYFAECLDKIIAESGATRIIFLLGNNPELWQAAKRYCAGPQSDNTWYCAPTADVASSVMMSDRLQKLHQTPVAEKPMKESTVAPWNAAEKAEIRRYARYFIQSISKRAAAEIEMVTFPDKTQRRRVCVAGGYHANYIDSLRTLSEGLAQADQDVVLCDFGPDPESLAAALGVSGDEGLRHFGTPHLVPYFDLFSHGQRDVFPARLGRWLSLYHADQVEAVNDLIAKDSFLPTSVKDAVNSIQSFLFTTAVPRIYYQLCLYSAFLKRSNPAVVLLCPSRPKEAMLLAAAADALGIPTVSFDPHILAASYPRNLAIYADHAFVISQYYADHYTGFFRIGADAVHVVGSIRLGQMLSSLGSQTRDTARERLGLAQSGNAMVLLVGQPVEWPVLMPCIERFAQAIAMLETKPRICLRLHREESDVRRDEYLQVFARHGLIDLVFDGKGDIGALITAADVVVGFFSTALLEAAAAGRNVLVVNPEGKQWVVDWSLMGLAQSATGPDSIAAALQHLMAQPASGQTAKEHSLPAVMQRICTAIDQIAELGIQKTAFVQPADIFVKFHKPLDIVA